MPHLLADLRFAVRRWTKRPTFAVTAILTLALGIGAATAIFSVINGVLLRPLPWKEPDRLVAVWVARPQWRESTALAAYWDRGDLSWPMFEGLREKRRTLASVGTYHESKVILGADRSRDRGGPNELVVSLKVSASFLPMLGTQPYLGRLFHREEDLTESDAVLVTHETWLRRYGASADILGVRVMLNDSPYVIVGVLPAGFRFGSSVPEFLLPFGNERDRGPDNHFMNGVARLPPGVTVEQAQADIAPVIQMVPAGSKSEVKLAHVVPTVLPVAASLLGETVVRLTRVDVGFDPVNVLVATVRSTTPLATEALRTARTSETIATLSALPGVVPDAKQREYRDAAAPMFYVLNRGIGSFLIRTAVPAESLMPAVREAIVSKDRGAVVSQLTTMDALLAKSIAEERYRAVLSSVFGVAALLLSAIGIYGIVARGVTDRLREFGVRSALGATPRNIRLLVFAQSARLVGIGLLSGIPSAFAASRAIGAMLYGVSPTAPHTFVVVTAVLSAAALLGTLAPVHRAGRVDPAIALGQG